VKIKNQHFSSTLSLYNSDFENVICILESELFVLNKDIILNINDQNTMICIFIMTFIDDMKQQ